jgi:hypothetical protein
MAEPPLKKPRVDTTVNKKDDWDPISLPGEDELNLKYTRETDVGITEFIHGESEGFDCILKYKYIV